MFQQKRHLLEGFITEIEVYLEFNLFYLYGGANDPLIFTHFANNFNRNNEQCKVYLKEETHEPPFLWDCPLKVLKAKLCQIANGLKNMTMF